MDVYETMRKLKIALPAAPDPAGLYVPAKSFAGGKLVFLSGCLPTRDDTLKTGRLGRDLAMEEGAAMARSAMLNALAVLHRELGDLNRIRTIVKITTFVASADDFYAQPAVANGGSQLLADVFGIENVPARSAVGVNVLPFNMPVETELLVELF